MGGIGSGRLWHHDARQTTCQYLELDVRHLAREGGLEPGEQCTVTWAGDVEPAASIMVRSLPGRVVLKYRHNSGSDDFVELEYPVYLASTPCHLGGHRQWFQCPETGCGRRVAILYGGPHFACRHCHRLAYPSTREEGYLRMDRRAEKIRRRLGWNADTDLTEATKPKGMHWATYYRLVDELEYWCSRSNAELVQHLNTRYPDLGIEL